MCRFMRQDITTLQSSGCGYLLLHKAASSSVEGTGSVWLLASGKSTNPEEALIEEGPKRQETDVGSSVLAQVAR